MKAASNLAILLAAKVGLFKICVGIALVIGSMKFLVVLAWALAIFKYVPDPYIYYNSHDYQKTPLHLDHNPFDHVHYGHGNGPHLHFFYVVATKLFVLKLVYGAIFYALIIKGWHFVSWFIHYLKEKKHDHHEYVEYDHDPSYHDHGHHHDHYGHDHHDHYGPVSYGSDSYGPYAYEKQGYGAYNKKAYDADGSYSVQS
ncbi:Uncharacterized protein OBRU01_08516 [Operophtera brumata]|uniref:Uncharacterized protein n=1 Tax=Operophtera brumata TaxID=104452 RepID=A0A0L7LGP7_OPEBR|nr:Uncharacterized protein OBRU01_08516 [Operophtera brumata]